MSREIHSDVVFRCLNSGVVRDVLGPILDSHYIQNRQADHYFYTKVTAYSCKVGYNLLDLIKVRWEILAYFSYDGRVFPAKLRIILIYSGLIQWLLDLVDPPIVRRLSDNSLLVGYKAHDLQ